MLQPSQKIMGLLMWLQYSQAHVRLKSKQQNILLQFEAYKSLPLTSGIICRILKARKDNWTKKKIRDS